MGFATYQTTSYFDNFYLRPITMENASGYINELNLTSTNPSTNIDSTYTLRLEDTANGKAFFSLSKFGETVDSSVGTEGETVSLYFENGDEAVNFKVNQVFDAEDNSGVWLEEIISASSDDLNIGVDDISIEPNYYQEEDMNIRFSVKNNGGIMYSGMPEIVVNTDGDSEIIKPELVLDVGESEQFDVVLKAPENPGSHTLTVSIDPEYTSIEKSVDYQVKALNPGVTTISSDLQEDNGIRGTVSIGSPFPAEYVDWNTMAVVRVYKVVDNGKKEIYSKDVPVTSSTFNVDLGYNEFYRGDGQYVVSVDTGGMQDSDLFEIVGDDFAYAPTGDEIPPTILTGELYPKLMMLLIGMVAAVSVRNHMQKVTRSLPLDIIAFICGIGVLVAAFTRGGSDMAAAGIILTGAGIGANVASRSDSTIGKMLMMDSHLHDFAGMLIVFASAAYIVLQVPEWSFFVVVGTLVGYYSALNLYRGR
ncbi:CARDB domain-containing protein [Methanococcoides sp. AM1]|uniref:CARDB domain-containing protein n=1 Tax=Methanococcoides sp. AM1 TaxID=1201011 RepID=UPI001438268D|nr:CARDB domain-containing protein [Methanococcoides sp. AM1]